MGKLNKIKLVVPSATHYAAHFRIGSGTCFLFLGREICSNNK